MTRPARAWVRLSHRTRSAHPSKRRWEVVYEDPTRNYRQRTKGGFTSKADADRWARGHRTATEQGRYIDSEAAAVTFRAFAEAWLAAQAFDRARTGDGYRKIITGPNSALNLAFGPVPLGDITHESVSQFLADLSSRRAPQTVRHHYYVLRQVLDYAVRSQRLATNPAMGVRLPRQRKVWEAEEERYPLTTAQVRAIVANLPPPYDTFTRLVAATGLRPEEATGLTLADVDAATGTVKVRAVVVDVGGRLVREEFTKTSKSRRTVTLDTATRDDLAAYVTAHKQQALAWFTEHPEHTHPGDALPLFVGVGVGRANGRPDLDRLDYSKPMRYAAFNKRHWRATVAAAGLPPVRFYDLRHAHASLLVDRLGQPGALTLKEVQERLGHSSAVMTLDRYAHAGQQDHDRSRTALDAALGSGAQDNVIPLRSGRAR